MDDEKSFLSALKTIRSSLLYILFFLFPLFFLTTTQEFYNLNKFYLLAFILLIYLGILTFEFLIVKKITWKRLVFDKILIFFFMAICLSVIFVSPNKIEAIVDTQLGLGIIFVLTSFFIIVSQNGAKPVYLKLLYFGAIILSVLNILFFLDPFKNISLPPTLQFLKSGGFTPVGSQLDLAVFLCFFVIVTVVNMIVSGDEPHNRNSINATQILALICLVLSLTLSCYTIIKPIFRKEVQSLLPPARYSWYTSVETLKQPKSAIFGVGPANYVSAFTRAKTLAYNQNNFWSLNFTSSRSFLLQIWTETGLLGLVAFMTLIISILFKIKKLPPATKFPLYYLIIVLIFFPPSLPVLFLLFTILTYLEDQLDQEGSHHTKHLDLSGVVPGFLGVAIVSFFFIAGASYFLGRHYLAEYYFKRSVDGITSNNAGSVYVDLRQAIVLNPYIERFRASFANINLLVANNIAGKGANKLTDQDRQNITQAVQTAVAESKAAVSLNPDKSGNWENLAIIYKNIINTAKGADGWTIASYQRAILADSINPMLRLSLGGVYYSLGNYDDAKTMFEQAINLKPDWANAHYNLAWDYFQKKEYKKAVETMQNALNLVDPKSVDYRKAQKELDDFKKNLPEKEGSAKTEKSSKIKPQQLSLPTPPPAVSPKIELPKEASPEAQ